MAWRPRYDHSISENIYVHYFRKHEIIENCIFLTVHHGRRLLCRSWLGSWLVDGCLRPRVACLGWLGRLKNVHLGSALGSFVSFDMAAGDKLLTVLIEKTKDSIKT